jgi:hypothetical protein
MPLCIFSCVCLFTLPSIHPSVYIYLPTHPPTYLPLSHRTCVHPLSWAASSYIAVQKITWFYGTQWFISVSSKANCPIQVLQLITLTSGLILFSLRHVSPESCPYTFFMYFLICSPYSTRLNVQLYQLLTCSQFISRGTAKCFRCQPVTWGVSDPLK